MKMSKTSPSCRDVQYFYRLIGILAYLIGCKMIPAQELFVSETAAFYSALNHRLLQSTKVQFSSLASEYCLTDLRTYSKGPIQVRELNIWQAAQSCGGSLQREGPTLQPISDGVCRG